MAITNRWRCFLKFALGLLLAIALVVLPPVRLQASPLASVRDLAVQSDGRKKPLDAVARETVTQIHGRDTYRQENGERLDSLRTYLALLLNDRDWNEEPFVWLAYQPLKDRAGLARNRKYFSFRELLESNLREAMLSAERKEAQDLDLSRDEREAVALEERLALMWETVGSLSLPLVPHPSDVKGTWVGLSEVEQYYPPELTEPLQGTYEEMRQAFRAGSEANVARAARDLGDRLAALSPTVYPLAATLHRETRFYRLHLFGKAWQAYALAFAIALLAILFPAKSATGRSSESSPEISASDANLASATSDNFSGAFSEVFSEVRAIDAPVAGSGAWGTDWLALGTFAGGLLVHGYGFVERVQIAGRPPVTNMYESVIWVSFGIAAIAFAFELCHRAKYYLLAGAPLAIAALLLADSLPAVLDASIKPLVPVLRDNFWLSVHVPTITLSYASFALAFGLGHILLGRYLFAPRGEAAIRRLARWNYDVLKVGVLLLATGIVLGGIWAHFSWGRFWGWDPKETWAFIALMCYAIPLHGRTIGWIGPFGTAVTSVISFQAVLMAWYGVNFVLGTGLHSYGFGTGGSEKVIASAIALDLAFCFGCRDRAPSAIVPCKRAGISSCACRGGRIICAISLRENNLRDLPAGE